MSDERVPRRLCRWYCGEIGDGEMLASHVSYVTFLAGELGGGAQGAG